MKRRNDWLNDDGGDNRARRLERTRARTYMHILYICIKHIYIATYTTDMNDMNDVCIMTQIRYLLCDACASVGAEYY